MSFTRDNGNVVFECDACGEFNDTETKDFNEAISLAKAVGWKQSMVGDQWFHYCSDACKADFKERISNGTHHGRE